MPFYTYVCDKCSFKSEVARKIDERDDAPQCLICLNRMHRKIDKPGLVWSPTTGRKYS